MNKLGPLLVVLALIFGASWAANHPTEIGEWMRRFQEASQSNQLDQPAALQPIIPAATMEPIPTMPPPSFPEGAVTEAGWGDIPRSNVGVVLYSLQGGYLDYYPMRIEEVSGAGAYLKSGDQRCTVDSQNYEDAVTCNGVLVLQTTREADGSMDSIRALNGFRFVIKR